MKLLTMVGSFAASPHTCSLFFRSLSISSIFFFLQPSCKQRKKHLDQNESAWKDACFEAAGQQVALSLDRWEGSNAFLTVKAKTQAQHSKRAGNGWKWGPSVMTEKLCDRAEGVVYVARTWGISRVIYVGALSCTSCFFLSSSTWLTLLWGAAGFGAWATYDTAVQSRMWKRTLSMAGEVSDTPDSKLNIKNSFCAYT